MPNILEVKDLKKEYPGVKAVDGISFSVKKGTCFGLLGPNGAGKTTAIEIIEGITASDGGSILYKNRPIGRAFHKETGIQFQATALQVFLTVKETLQLFHKLYPNPSNFDEIVEECSLKNLLSRDNRKLSGGQRQRLLVAIALVNQPELLFMDEPTTGLDPQARRNFWNMVEKIKLRNTTLILTTHYMEEADRLCNRLAIIDNGKIVALDTPDALKAQVGGDTVQMEVSEPENAAKELDKLECVSRREARENRLDIAVKDVGQNLPESFAAAGEISNFSVRNTTLDDVFMHYTGYDIRDEGAEGAAKHMQGVAGTKK